VGTVRTLLHKKIRDAYVHPQFISDVMKPMKIEPIMDQEVTATAGTQSDRRAKDMPHSAHWSHAAPPPLSAVQRALAVQRGPRPMALTRAHPPLVPPSF